LASGILLVAVPVAAQLVPGVSLPQLPVVGTATQSVEQTLDRPLDDIRHSAEGLVHARTDRIAELLRRQRAFVEPDANGEPAVRGELLLLDPGAATLGAARDAGFTELGSEEFGSLGISVMRLETPSGLS